VETEPVTPGLTDARGRGNQDRDAPGATVAVGAAKDDDA